jgi:phosphate starvation-inducible protein PhoH and related proteins
MSKKKNRLPEEEQKLVSSFEPKTERQKEFYDSIMSNEITICSGLAGSGKTYVALAAALSLLGDFYKKIILVKSVMSVKDEAIGFIPGDINQKMEPYIMSYTLNIDKIINGKCKGLMDKKIIEVLPLAYIRGVTIDNSIVILDEAQNLTTHLFKTIISRIGDDSKYIILGDTEQCDMSKKSESCLQKIIDIFRDSDFIHVVEFQDEDCIRNKIIPKILNKLRDNNI